MSTVLVRSSGNNLWQHQGGLRAPLPHRCLQLPTVSLRIDITDDEMNMQLYIHVGHATNVVSHPSNLPTLIIPQHRLRHNLPRGLPPCPQLKLTVTLLEQNLNTFHALPPLSDFLCEG